MKVKKFVSGIALIAALVLAASSAFAAPARVSDPITGNPIASIVEECAPAVVNIDVESLVERRTRPFNPFGNDPFFRDFFGQQDNFRRMVPMRGKGSGFIVDGEEGYILTNNHVVAGADTITVTLLDGRILEAELIGSDPTFDLAVIQVQVDGENLPNLILGDSDEARVGEWVVAIGNPHGFENSVTAGIISAKNRTIQASNINFRGFMQTDAAINPGNSGGPLINLSGEVVGINTAIVPFAQGMGFAVPVNMAKQIMSDLIERGEVNRGWLGVVLQNLTPALAEVYNVPAEDGAVIADITADSPAGRAGLRPGDTIVAIDEDEIRSSQDVVYHIRSKLAGDDVSVEFYRDSERQSIDVTLGEIPSDMAVERPGGNRDRQGSGDSQATQLGATVRVITPELMESYNLDSDKGLVVVGVERGSIAGEMGLREGDQILEVNRREINGISDWNRLLRGGEARTIVMWVNRGGQNAYFTYRAEN